MTLFYKSFTLLVWMRLALGTIPGLSYMDPIRQKPLDSKLPGEDPCNPLYWYPKTIPEYCYFKPQVTITITEKPPLPVPLPVPIPLPVPMPLPVSMPLPIPMPLPNPVPPPVLMPVPQHHPGLPMPLPIMPPPSPILPPPAIPIGLPPSYAQSPMVPIAPANPLIGPNLQSHFPFPYPIHEPQLGLVPGLPGLVTDDGGINIMPFSDVYADMLEKHKYKMIRKKLRRIINEYEHFPSSRKWIRLKKFNKLMDL